MNSLHRVIDAAKGKLPHKIQKECVINPDFKMEFLKLASHAVCYDFGKLNFDTPSVTSTGAIQFALPEWDEEFVMNSFGSILPLAAHLLMALHFREVETRKVQPDAKANQWLAWDHKTPVTEHTEVVLKPTIVRYEKNAGSKGTHASPRFHYRTAHYRTYHRGTPEEFKIRIEQMKVGSRELGTVTHDYIVQVNKEVKND